MRAMRPLILPVVLVLISCTSSARGQDRGASPKEVDSLVLIRSDGSRQVVTLDSARLDSLTRAGILLQKNVDERPEILSGPQLRYPRRARRACITGRVIIQAVVGRDGRAEVGSVRVRQSVDPDIDQAAVDYMTAAFFKPAKLGGVTVRTLVNVPVDFKIRGAC